MLRRFMKFLHLLVVHYEHRLNSKILQADGLKGLNPNNNLHSVLSASRAYALETNPFAMQPMQALHFLELQVHETIPTQIKRREPPSE